MRWVEVVEVEADVAAALVAAAEAGPVAWEATRPPDRAATASVLPAGTECRTSPVSRATKVPQVRHADDALVENLLRRSRGDRDGRPCPAGVARRIL